MLIDNPNIECGSDSPRYPINNNVATIPSIKFKFLLFLLSFYARRQ
jgi:hypothetical protein